MPDARPIAEWPLLLCGPMLRNVSSRSVSVFVATKERCSVRLTVYEGNTTGATNVGNASAQTIALGQRLHVCVITVTLSSILTPAQTYGYDVSLQPASGSPQTLAQLGLLSGPYPLGYADGKLPTFSRAPIRQYLRIVHGSCRKAHGPGRDALPILDGEISKVLTDAALSDRERALRRPHQLFLTGDQIYADDVSLCLLKTLMATAKDLLGWNERLDFSNAYTSGTVQQDSGDVQPGNSRYNFLLDDGQLTCERELLATHLLFMGEFCAMYLMSWSNALWPRDDDGDLWLPEAEDFVPEGDQETEWYEKAEDDRDHALEFAEDLPRVRRALANVPTWMMFDDHEVTDDWNLHGDWYRAALESDIGRRLQRNALLAYAVFQDWGNRPDIYANDAGADILDALTVSSSEPPIVATPDLCDVLLDLRVSAGDPPTAGRMRWDYLVGGIEHQVIVLDIRTWRDYPGGADGAGLISDGSLAQQLDARLPSPGDTDLLTLVVSGAPVFGHPIVEEGAQRVKAAALGPTAADNEPWGVNRRAFEYLLERLCVFRSVVLLSGDVHYAFSNHVAYFPAPALYDPPAAGHAVPAAARFVQLCGSSLKNQDNLTNLLGHAGYVGIDKDGWFRIDADLGSLKWELLGDVRSLRPGEQEPPLVRRTYHRYVVAHRLSPPAVVPDGPWQAAAYDLIQQLGQPDCSYNVFHVGDTRSRTERIEGATGAVGPLFLAAEVVSDHARRVVGSNSISDVTFEAARTSAEKVIHRIFWWTTPFYRPLSEVTVMHTRHVLPLGAPRESERPKAHKWSAP